MSTRARLSILALVVGVVIGALTPGWVVPTVSAWVDKGGSRVTMTAIDQPAPEVAGPVEADATVNGTSFPSIDWYLATPNQACFRVSIATNSVEPTRVPWRLILHTGQPPFNNTPPFDGLDGNFSGNGDYTFAPAPDYGTTGDYYATPNQSFMYASSTVPFLADICANNTPLPAWQPQGPDTYEISNIQLVVQGTTPCVVITLVGHQPFYIGFTAQFNWAEFLDTQAITPAQKAEWLTYNYWRGNVSPYEGSQGATGSGFSVTLTPYNSFYAVISNRENRTISSCASYYLVTIADP